jgi:hypothetical protein
VNTDVVYIYYRPQLASEYATETLGGRHQCITRVPPLHKDGSGGAQFKNTIQAVLQSRLAADDEYCGKFINEGDCFVIGDGGKDCNGKLIQGAFVYHRSDSGKETSTLLSKQYKKLAVYYDEGELVKWRGVPARSGLTLEQIETFYFISPSRLKAKKRQRMHFDHLTTSGTIIGPCAFPAVDDPSTWKMTIGQKKLLYGSARLSLGSSPGEPAPKQQKQTAQPRTDDTVEPVTFFGMTKQIAEELVHQAGNIDHSANVKCFIDLTSDIVMGGICLERGIPYLAITHTEFHRRVMLTRLAQIVFQAYLTPESPLHEPHLHKVWVHASLRNNKASIEQLG